MSSKEGRAFFGKGCCEKARTPSGKEKEEHFWQKVLQKCTDAKRQKKGGLERFFKVECQVFLSKEIVLGHPCIPRVRVNTVR